MWPHMTGENTVKLILQTADKSYDGYDVGVDGQGRLDMDKATQPVGATGIPTDGRTTGNTISSTGYIAGGSSIPNEVSSLIVEIDEVEEWHDGENDDQSDWNCYHKELFHNQSLSDQNYVEIGKVHLTDYLL